ncbi:metal-sulfur cluster assembly factor [Azospirillum soli]|uniref:metal-sulfur cluster assembly factor n=1 Tax=Azospirillum soli TaxID=1304799 RepID=UPI001AE48079|nr:metal-sulfur cluster assembly factor [Azospirillum soli]MBP2315566.1 metal-sulfur cluster biosynthetic enzyme [Azospirillum soli]
MGWTDFLTRLGGGAHANEPPLTVPVHDGTSPLDDTIRAALRTVLDPELGLNIVDLGLLYAIDATEERVRVDISLTTPTCPLGETVAADARAAIRRALPDVPDLDVRLVWDPPWKPSMMSDDARRQLGW